MKPFFRLRTIAAPLFLGISCSLALPLHAQQAQPVGDVYSWGENYYGSVGNGNQYDNYTPTHTLGLNGQGHLTGVVQVAAGGFQSLALKSDGTVWAWGRNAFSPIGVGGATDQWTPKQVVGLNGQGFFTDAAFVGFVDYLHPAAVKRDGTVWTWGKKDFVNYQGYQTARVVTSPEIVPDITNVAQISGALALKKDGTLWVWDDNSGQVVDFGLKSVHTPPQQVRGPGGVGFLTNVVSIYNATAQESMVSSDIPNPRPDIRDIPYRGNVYYAVTSDGSLYRWGTKQVFDVPTQQWSDQTLLYPEKVTTITNVAKVKGGLALKKDGTLTYLIDGAALKGLTQVVDMDRYVAVRSDGSVWRWSSAYALPSGSSIYVTVDSPPARIQGLPATSAVSATTEFLVIADPSGAILGPDPEPAATPIVRGNVSAAGEPGDWPSFNAALSNALPTGDQTLAFVTAATHLLPGDTGYIWNIGAKNLKTGSIAMADSTVSGVPSNSWSFFPSISADGSKVAFTSYGNNLVSGDTNASYDVFVKNLKTNEVQLASSDATGKIGNATSGFYGVSLSGDGNSVAYASYCNNLVPGYGSGFSDIFVKNLNTGKVVRANVTGYPDFPFANFNSFFPSLNSDGTKVAFVSFATNLVDSDTNGFADVFVKNLSENGGIVRVGPAGAAPNGFSTYPALSENGRYVAFASLATNMTANADANNGFDVFVQDLQTGILREVSVTAAGSAGNGESWAPSISADGQYIAFYSKASVLVAGDTNGVADVFVKDMQTETIWRASRAANGTQANGGRGWDSDTGSAVSLSPDGRSVGFDSGASNLVPNDVNGVSDVFINNLIR